MNINRLYFPRCAQLVEVIFSGRQMMCQKHAGVRMTCGRWRVKECCTKVMYVYNGNRCIVDRKNKKKRGRSSCNVSGSKDST